MTTRHSRLESDPITTLIWSFAQMRIEDSAEQTHNHTDLHTPKDNKTAEDRLAAIRALKQGLPPPNCGFMTLPLELRLMIYRDALITTSMLSQRDISHYIMGWQDETLPSFLNAFPGLRAEAFHTVLEINIVQLEPYLGMFSMIAPYEVRHGLVPSDQGCLRLRHALIDFVLRPETIDTAAQDVALTMKALPRCQNLDQITFRFLCDGVDVDLGNLGIPNGSLKKKLPRRKMLTLTLEVVAPTWTMESATWVTQWFLDLLGLERAATGQRRPYKGYGPLALWPRRGTEHYISTSRAELEERGGGICLLVRRRWFEWGKWEEKEAEKPGFLAIPQHDLDWDKVPSKNGVDISKKE